MHYSNEKEINSKDKKLLINKLFMHNSNEKEIINSEEKAIVN